MWSINRLMICVTIAFTLLPSSYSAVKAPPYLKTCSRNNAKLDECALRNGREIIPYLVPGDRTIRLPPLDPLVLEKLEIKPMGNSRSAGLSMTCTKCKIIGLGESTLQDIHIDLGRSHLDLDIAIPFLSIMGKYQISGRILVLPVTGKGDTNITIPDLSIKLGLDWKITKRKGDEYAEITKYKVNFTTTRLYLHLTNLFNGDKILGENMNNFLNENWEEVLKDFRPAVSETIGETIKLILNNIFELLPFDMVFPKK